MQRVDGRLQTVELKTASSRRTVVLPRFAVRHLQEHKKRQDAERLPLWDAWREHGPVFASTIGTPIEPRNVNRRWDELRRKAGLDWLRLHDLRHGYATFLQGRGVASDATFREKRQDTRPALQLPQPSRRAGRSRQQSGDDLRCHHPVVSTQTMLQPLLLHPATRMMRQMQRKAQRRGEMPLPAGRHTDPFSRVGKPLPTS